MKFKRLLAMPAPERHAALEAALMLSMAEILLWIVPFSRLSRWLGAADKGSADADADAADVVRVALKRAGRTLPWRPSCLRLALAGALMLRRRNLPWTVHFGVDLEDHAVVAHAWLKAGDTFVCGAAEHSRFTPIAAFHGPGRA